MLQKGDETYSILASLLLVVSMPGVSFNKSFFIAVPAFFVTEVARAACFALSYYDLVELSWLGPRCALVILVTLMLLSGIYLRTLDSMQFFYASKKAEAA